MYSSPSSSRARQRMEEVLPVPWSGYREGGGEEDDDEKKGVRKEGGREREKGCVSGRGRSKVRKNIGDLDLHEGGREGGREGRKA